METSVTAAPPTKVGTYDTGFSGISVVILVVILFVLVCSWIADNVEITWNQD